MFKKNLIMIGTFSALAAAFGAMSVNAASTSTLNFYDGVIESYYSNALLDSDYRSATSTSVPWQVSLVNSGEGNGTITTYWLENKNGTNLTVDVEVTQGRGLYKNNPESGANQKTVYLAVENNNFSGNVYSVNGYWSEE